MFVLGFKFKPTAVYKGDAVNDYMIAWLKFFTLGFFSDKLTDEAPKRKYYNPLLGLLLAFLLFVAALIAADFVPFQIHYGKAEGFNAMIYNAFASESSDRISMRIQDGKLTAKRNGGGFVNDKLVNSFSESGDSQYAVAGYNLVVDTRSLTSYNAFEATFDDGRMSATEYAELSYTAKQDCKTEIVLTDAVRELDDAFIAECIEYLERSSTLTDVLYEKSIAEKYVEIQNSEETADYSEIYELYLQAYYPQTFSDDSGIPTLRDFYAQQYIENQSVTNYLFVFEDMIVGSFSAENGVSRMFYGYISKLSDGEVVTVENLEDAERQVDEFILSAYRGSLTISSYLYFINARRIFLYELLLWLVYALIAFALVCIIKLDLLHKYGAWLKIAGSFLFIGGLITAVVAFICGFFVSVDTVFSLIVPLFAAIVFVRFAVYFACSCIRAKRRKQTTNEADDVFQNFTDNPQ